MSLHSYRLATELRGQDLPFSTLIMAAIMKADTPNMILLRTAFPIIFEELWARTNAIGGVLEGE